MLLLYAKAITLRNCGRFTVVASDFGSDYRTHTHVTSESLFAGLTRKATWRAKLIDLKNDYYNFAETYDIQAMPIWFLPGIFMDNGSHRLPDSHFDTTAFNVVNEVFPSTSKSYVYRKEKLEEKGRPYHIPTYGTIQAIKPDRRLFTCGFSPRKELLDSLHEGQTFMIGKKRTMFQITDLSPTIGGQWKTGVCTTGWLELPPDCSKNFRQFQILTATMRYLILRGETKEEVGYWKLPFSDGDICLPDFYWSMISEMMGIS